jgi:large subunit ribosomal protein L5
MESLTEMYNKVALPELTKKFGYKSKMAAPKIVKVVLNTGFGRQVAGKSNEEQRKTADFIAEDISAICGQKAIKTVAKKSIASFSLRKGVCIGVKATLRGQKMRDFIEKLIYVVIPRTRDFKGIDQKSMDGKGNLTIAIKEHIVFPEILAEKAKNIFGLEITVVTTAKNKEEGMDLLRLLGFPIKIKNEE